MKTLKLRNRAHTCHNRCPPVAVCWQSIIPAIARLHPAAMNLVLFGHSSCPPPCRPYTCQVCLPKLSPQGAQPPHCEHPIYAIHKLFPTHQTLSLEIFQNINISTISTPLQGPHVSILLSSAACSLSNHRSIVGGDPRRPDAETEETVRDPGSSPLAPHTCPALSAHCKLQPFSSHSASG